MAVELMANLASLYYLLVIVGGVNWLVVGARLLFDESLPVCSGNSTAHYLVPDALEWAGETAQIVVYYVVGISSLLLLVWGVLGHWIRKGEPLITCDTELVVAGEKVEVKASV